MKDTAQIKDLLSPPLADPDAEKMVLGSILVSGTPNETFSKVCEHVQPQDFDDEANRIVFENMLRLCQAGKPIDIKLLEEMLKSSTAQGKTGLETVGGRAYLGSVITSAPTAAHVVYYALIVRDNADKRRLHDMGIETVQASHNGKPPVEAIARLREALSEVERRQAGATYRRFTAAELDDARIDVDYIVNHVLAAKHVGGIIGPSKSLKTTIAADLAFSVATGGQFLGYFPVLRSARTAFMSGENGLPTLQETFRRIARAAGRELREATNLIVSDELPQLHRADHMVAIRRFIEKDAIELLIIDPLYLGADTDGREASLFAMGALLKPLAEVANNCGVTLLIVHHSTQNSAKTSSNKNPELADSAWAGTQEFFRQWIVINRRSPYDPDRPGRHELRLVTGGSMGHATGVALDIDEGSRTDPDGTNHRRHQMQTGH